jgi:hypothetical protein
MKKKYGIEIALENLIKEITRLVRGFRKFVFTIPKNKMDKYIYMMDILAWTMLTISIVLRIGR